MKKIKAYGICIYTISNKSIKILLCKSALSNTKWGFLKGVEESNEDMEETAIREFYEESSIGIQPQLLEQYFEQKNKEKDIGIYLVNSNHVTYLNKFFNKDTLYDKYLSGENSKVKFFDISNLPLIKKKQSKLVVDVVNFLKSKNQFH